MALSEREMKREAVQHVPFWWHTIDLGDGIVTPGENPTREQELRSSAIPCPLQGKRSSTLAVGTVFFLSGASNGGLL